jgi:hypothetical protein
VTEIVKEVEVTVKEVEVTETTVAVATVAVAVVATVGSGTGGRDLGTIKALKWLEVWENTGRSLRRVLFCDRGAMSRKFPPAGQRKLITSPSGRCALRATPVE